MTIVRLPLLLAAVLVLCGQAPPTPTYAAGQVWEYRTRPQDAGSLLKIQRVEPAATSTVYHVSVIGLRFTKPGMVGILPHLPVSAATLDASVTRRSSSPVAFPDEAVQDGIDEWRRANGGVFTISMAQVIQFVDDATSGMADPTVQNQD